MEPELIQGINWLQLGSSAFVAIGSTIASGIMIKFISTGRKNEKRLDKLEAEQRILHNLDKILD